MAANPTQDGAPAEKASGGRTASSAIEEYVAQRTRFREAIEKIRERSEVTAKALGALGTTALTAVGVAKFGDVFPLPHGWRQDPSLRAAVAATVGGFMLVGLAIGVFTARLWKVNAPIVVSSDDEQLRRELGANHRWNRKRWEKAKQNFDATATARSAPTLRAFEARAERLDRLADKERDADRRDELRSAAAAIRAEIGATLAHVAADAVRDRATRAVSGLPAALFGAVFLGGLVAFATGADYLDGERTGRASVAKDCAAAVKALDEQALRNTELPLICVAGSGHQQRTLERSIAAAAKCAGVVKQLDEQRLSAARLAVACTGEDRLAEDSSPATSDSVSAAAVVELGRRTGECFAAARNAADTSPCQRLARALASARLSGS